MTSVGSTGTSQVFLFSKTLSPSGKRFDGISFAGCFSPGYFRGDSGWFFKCISRHTGRSGFCGCGAAANGGFRVHCHDDSVGFPVKRRRRRCHRSVFIECRVHSGAGDPAASCHVGADQSRYPWVHDSGNRSGLFAEILGRIFRINWRHFKKKPFPSGLLFFLWPVSAEMMRC